jgi:hypothetical protein
MFRRGRKSLIVTALLAAFVAGPGAAEAAGGKAREGADLWSRLLGWLGGQIGMVIGVREDTGHYIDPNGQPQLDEGPAIDPDGQPRLNAYGDAGPFIDPDGQPK